MKPLRSRRQRTSHPSGGGSIAPHASRDRNDHAVDLSQRALARRSASIRAAASSSGGSSVLRTTSLVARLACAETLTAATTWPSRSRIGAATERSPSSSSWSTSAQPCARMRASSPRSSALGGQRAGGQRPEVHALQVGGQLVIGQPPEQHAAHRRRVGREARADADRHAHDARGRHARDVDDVVAVEHRQRRRLAHLGDQALEVRLGDLGQRQRWTGTRTRARARAAVSANRRPSLRT